MCLISCFLMPDTVFNNLSALCAASCPTSHRMRHAACGMRHAACGMRHALAHAFVLPHAPGIIARCLTPIARCLTPIARCLTPIARCLTPKAQRP
jgi:hypothetical protein